MLSSIFVRRLGVDAKSVPFEVAGHPSAYCPQNALSAASAALVVPVALSAASAASAAGLQTSSPRVLPAPREPEGASPSMSHVLSFGWEALTARAAHYELGGPVGEGGGGRPSKAPAVPACAFTGAAAALAQQGMGGVRWGGARPASRAAAVERRRAARCCEDRRGTDAEVFHCTPGPGAAASPGALVSPGVSAPAGSAGRASASEPAGGRALCSLPSGPQLVVKRLRRGEASSSEEDWAHLLKALREVSVHDLAGGHQRTTHLVDVFADPLRRICLVQAHAGQDLCRHAAAGGVPGGILSVALRVCRRLGSAGVVQRHPGVFSLTRPPHPPPRSIQ